MLAKLAHTETELPVLSLTAAEVYVDLIAPPQGLEAKIANLRPRNFHSASALVYGWELRLHELACQVR